MFALAFLFMFCMTTVYSATISPFEIPAYDPWKDMNDDGKINILDLIGVANGLQGTGQAVNKTALLYNVNATFTELLSKIAYLNASLMVSESNLRSEIENLKATVAYLNASLMASESSLRFQIETLNATLNQRIDSLITQIISMNATIADLVSMIESHAIAVNSTYVSFAATTETMNFIDVTGLSVNINVNTPCYLMVMFSTMGYNYLDDFSSGQIYVHAKVDSTVLSPSTLYLNPQVGTTGWAFLPSHSHNEGRGTYSYNFKPQPVTAGNHTAKIQWRVSSGTGYLYYSTLTVIAFPTP